MVAILFDQININCVLHFFINYLMMRIIIAKPMPCNTIVENNQNMICYQFNNINIDYSFNIYLTNKNIKHVKRRFSLKIWNSTLQKKALIQGK